MPVLMSQRNTMTVALSMAISRLRTHEGQDLIVGPGLDAAGVHEGRTSGPCQSALAVNPVAGHAGGVLHNGQPPADAAY